MRKAIWRNTCLVMLALSIGGCSMGRQVSSFSIDYNRAIANSRDEMLFLNILRARYREPLQFSTISGVTGTLQVGGSMSVAGNNVAAWRTRNNPANDVPGSISPTLTVSTSSSPTFSIQPLSDKDFTAEMLTPITPETVDLLLKQNWDPEFILPIVIGSVTCNGVTYPNSYHKDRDTLAKALSANVWTAKFVNNPSASEPGKIEQAANGTASLDQSGGYDLTLPTDKAMSLIQSGLGSGYAVHLVSIDNAKQTALLRVTTVRSVWQLSGLPIYCPEDGGPLHLDQPSGNSVNERKLNYVVNTPSEKGPLAAARISVQFRSVEAIIYYLGEALRNPDIARISYHSDCHTANGIVTCDREKTLFEVHTGRPDRSAVIDTTLEGTRFWVPASLDPEGADRTMSTLSVLSELIALQTRDEAKSLPQPVINVGR